MDAHPPPDVDCDVTTSMLFIYVPSVVSASEYIMNTLILSYFTAGTEFAVNDVTMLLLQHIMTLSWRERELQYGGHV